MKKKPRSSVNGSWDDFSKHFQNLVDETKKRIEVIVEESFQNSSEFESTVRVTEEGLKEIDLKTTLGEKITPIKTRSLQYPRNFVFSIKSTRENIKLIREDEAGVGSKNIPPRAGLLKFKNRILFNILQSFKGSKERR